MRSSACKRTLKDAKTSFGRVVFRDIDDADTSDDLMPPLGDRVFMPFTVGACGALNRDMVRAAARGFQKAIVRYPRAIFMLHVAGYDDDPRELWQIPEVCDYLCRWARRVGLQTLEDCENTPLNPFDVALLAKCGAFKDVDPDDFKINPDREHVGEVLAEWRKRRR